MTESHTQKPWQRLHQGQAVLHEAWQRVAFVSGLVASVIILFVAYLLAGDG